MEFAIVFVSFFTVWIHILSFAHCNTTVADTEKVEIKQTEKAEKSLVTLPVPKEKTEQTTDTTSTVEPYSVPGTSNTKAITTITSQPHTTLYNPPFTDITRRSYMRNDILSPGRTRFTSSYIPRKNKRRFKPGINCLSTYKGIFNLCSYRDESYPYYIPPHRAIANIPLRPLKDLLYNSHDNYDGCTPGYTWDDNCYICVCGRWGEIKCQPSKLCARSVPDSPSSDVESHSAAEPEEFQDLTRYLENSKNRARRYIENSLQTDQHKNRYRRHVKKDRNRRVPKRTTRNGPKVIQIVRLYTKKTQRPAHRAMMNDEYEI